MGIALARWIGGTKTTLRCRNIPKNSSQKAYFQLAGIQKNLLETKEHGQMVKLEDENSKLFQAMAAISHRKNSIASLTVPGGISLSQTMNRKQEYFGTTSKIEWVYVNFLASVITCSTYSPSMISTPLKEIS